MGQSSRNVFLHRQMEEQWNHNDADNETMTNQNQQLIWVNLGLGLLMGYQDTQEPVVIYTTSWSILFLKFIDGPKHRPFNNFFLYTMARTARESVYAKMLVSQKKGAIWMPLCIWRIFQCTSAQLKGLTAECNSPEIVLLHIGNQNPLKYPAQATKTQQKHLVQHATCTQKRTFFVLTLTRWSLLCNRTELELIVAVKEAFED